MDAIGATSIRVSAAAAPFDNREGGCVMRNMNKVITACGIAAAIAVAASVASFSSVEAASEPTPAERKIQSARTRIERAPSRHEGHNDLAMALAKRARETANPDFYTQAEAALRESRRIAPGNIEADRIDVWLLLGKHEFGAALDRARALNKRVPDDLMSYAMIVDAALETGRYAEAEEAAQWMLNMRPGAVPGLTRAAYLRELFGDPEGALELMRTAIDQIQPRETEERAWVLTQMSHLELLVGRVDRAQQAAEGALRLFPGYHYALAALAAVHEHKGEHARGAALLGERYQSAPHPENLFAWAVALDKAGQTVERDAKLRTFEAQARLEMNGADNANRELALYYADYAGRPGEAVQIMEREVTRRRDLHTVDTYAWSLYKAGRLQDAQRAAREALAVGTIDPTIKRHAATILGAGR
jgi:tetratricopeptide (TPR) repeat protein